MTMEFRWNKKKIFFHYRNIVIFQFSFFNSVRLFDEHFAPISPVWWGCKVWQQFSDQQRPYLGVGGHKSVPLTSILYLQYSTVQ